jgi:hypothetical protein
MYVTIDNFLSPFEIAVLANLSVGETHLWERGRQETGYEKLDLRSLATQDIVYKNLADRALALIGAPHDNHWDMWLLRYPDGAHIPPHRDEAAVFGLHHRRLNALVQAPRAGGDLWMNGTVVPLTVGNGVLFYPDRVEHAVSQVTGTRAVFSVGAWI